LFGKHASMTTANRRRTQSKTGAFSIRGAEHARPGRSRAPPRFRTLPRSRMPGAAQKLPMPGCMFLIINALKLAWASGEQHPPALFWIHKLFSDLPMAFS
jgi:hypothetical protein